MVTLYATKLKAFLSALRIFLGFFLTGLVIMLVSLVFYHLTYTRTFTTAEVVNPNDPSWWITDFFRITWYLGFIVWACYPVYLVIMVLGKKEIGFRHLTTNKELKNQIWIY